MIRTNLSKKSWAVGRNGGFTLCYLDLLEEDDKNSNHLEITIRLRSRFVDVNPASVISLTRADAEALIRVLHQGLHQAGEEDE